MDLAVMNNSLEYTMQNVDQEVNYNDNFLSPTWSSSEIINNEELLSFIGDNNYHFMDTFDKLNSPKLDKEIDIRDSLLEFIQEQLKASEGHNLDTNNTDTALLNCNIHDHKQFVKERVKNSTATFLRCSTCRYATNNETDFNNHFSSHSTQDNCDLHLGLSKTNNVCFADSSEALCSTRDYISSNQNQVTSIPSSESVVVNQNVVDIEERFICKECTYSTEAKCALKVHMITHSNMYFICNVCDFQADRNAYLMHIKQHAHLNVECPLCCYAASEDKMIKHILGHDNKYDCGFCSYSTGTNQDLVKSKISNNFTCSLCDYKTKYESYLQKHVLHHFNKKSFQCDSCEYKATNKKTLIEHCSKHTGLYFKCKICDFKTIYQKNIKKHEVIHSGEKRFLCTVCGFRFAQRSNLKAHISTHMGHKNYECYLCDYKATQKINLKAHIITHVGEKNLACNVCNYKAINRNTLKTHMSVHNAEKIFDCNLCNYKTAHKSGLRRHLRMHTGEKNFLCNICDYKTSRKDYINRHMLKHTGEKNFLCNLCDYKTAYRNSLNVHNALVHSADVQ